MSERVFVLGAGRAGRSLARALLASGVSVVGLHGRHVGDDEATVTVGALPPPIGSASVVLVTVRDGQLDEALTELTRAPLAEGAVVLHASGSADPPELEELRRLGHPSGTLHPLVPLADPASAPAALRGAWFGIDGDPEARRAATALARAVGADVVEIPAGGKARYHAAAVFAANFPVVLADIAAQLLAEVGVAERQAVAAVRTLMARAVENLRTAPPEAVLTGPIARGDAEAVRRHLYELANEPIVFACYLTLSQAALAIARKGHTPPERLDEVEEALLRPA